MVSRQIWPSCFPPRAKQNSFTCATFNDLRRQSVQVYSNERLNIDSAFPNHANCWHLGGGGGGGGGVLLCVEKNWGPQKKI
jgi:hypothetical protein